MVAIVAFISTTAPSSSRIVSTPALGEGSSKVALSDSNSQIISSILTVSPVFFIHCEIVTSVIDSPTDGIKTFSTSPLGLGVGSSFFSLLFSGDDSFGFSTFSSVLDSPSSILQINAPISSVSPSLATILNVPEASEGNSNVALSDSSSHIISSILTVSPSFFTQVAIVTSVTDSPTDGTFISIAIRFPLRTSRFIYTL